MKLYPIKFIEVYKQYIWGGSGLEMFNKMPPNNFAAESWEIACHKDGMSIVEDGFLKGKTLKELTSKYGSDLLGERVDASISDFPLLVKFINAKNKLSVQVHPDDEYALVHEGEQGKNEAWVVVEASDDAELIIDVKEGMTREKLQKAIILGEIDNCLNRIRVQAGDIVNIPAGLIHAIGEGIMLVEIQQNSNITYRVYDYDRKNKEGLARPLHIDKALDVIDFSTKRKDKITKGVTVKSGNSSLKTIAIANEYFCLETYDIKEEIKQSANGETFLIYIFTDGSGQLEYDNNIISVSKGDTYLVPANLGAFSIEGDVKFIKAYVPDVNDDIIQPLKGMGYSYDDMLESIDGMKKYVGQGNKS